MLKLTSRAEKIPYSSRESVIVKIQIADNLIAEVQQTVLFLFCSANRLYYNRSRKIIYTINEGENLQSLEPVRVPKTPASPACLYSPILSFQNYARKHI